jgi:hypothetical protein
MTSDRLIVRTALSNQVLGSVPPEVKRLFRESDGQQVVERFAGASSTSTTDVDSRCDATNQRSPIADLCVTICSGVSVYPLARL